MCHTIYIFKIKRRNQEKYRIYKYIKGKGRNKMGKFLTFSIRIEEEDQKIMKNLKEKHHINISHLLRECLRYHYKKLNEK